MSEWQWPFKVLFWLSTIIFSFVEIKWENFKKKKTLKLKSAGGNQSNVLL